MIRTATFALFMGVLILHHLPRLPLQLSPWISLGVLLIPTLVAVILLIFYRSYYTRILLFCVIGFFWAHFQASSLLQNKLPEALIGKNIQLEGYIASLPNESRRKTRFDFDVVKVLSPSLDHFPSKLQLSLYKPNRLSLNVGDKWRFTVRVKPPRDFANPGRFAYRKWLLQKGILATGYVRNKQATVLLEDSVFSYPVQRFRQHLQRRLNNSDIETHLLPFVRALVIGDRSGLSVEDWAVLQKTGTVHLMAISGLHVGLVAAFVFFVTRLVWSWIPAAAAYFAAPRAAAIVAWLFAALYSALAGFALPTQRALIMLSIVLLVVVIKKRVQPTYILSLALLVILVFDSFAVLSVSFWLSFGAVGLIYYFIYTTSRAGMQNRRAKFKMWLNLQIVISLGLLPLTIQFFQQAPILSPIANVVAVPVVGFIIVPLSFIACVLLFVHDGLSAMVFDVIAHIFSWLWAFLHWFSQLSFSTYAFATPSIITLAFALLGLLVFFLPRVFRVRLLGLLCCLPILFPFHEKIQHGEFILTVLDVGQGLSSVIQTAEHSLVFDTGPKYSRAFDTGRAVVIPFLREAGIKRLDRLFVSHADNDHIGGAQSIMSSMVIDEVVTSVPDTILRSVPGNQVRLMADKPPRSTTDKIRSNVDRQARNTADRPIRNALDKSMRYTSENVKRCQRGQSWEWDGVLFEVLHPDKVDYASGLSENDLSCVLLISSHSQRIVLTGDIEQAAEALILQRYKNLQDIDVLVVPHHGSKTSSTPEFVQSLTAKIAIMPVGWRNRFGFPHSSVVKRYQAINSGIFLTSESGAITYKSKGKEIHQFHLHNRSYWDQR